MKTLSSCNLRKFNSSCSIILRRQVARSTLFTAMPRTSSPPLNPGVSTPWCGKSPSARLTGRKNLGNIDYIIYYYICICNCYPVEKDLLHAVIKACSSNTIVAVFIITKTVSRKPLRRFTFTLLEHIITAPFLPLSRCLTCIAWGMILYPLICEEKNQQTQLTGTGFRMPAETVVV